MKHNLSRRQLLQGTTAGLATFAAGGTRLARQREAQPRLHRRRRDGRRRSRQLPSASEAPNRCHLRRGREPPQRGGERCPNARNYTDWRELLDKEGDKIDSVNVTVPDHMHAPIPDVARCREESTSTARSRSATTWPSAAPWPAADRPRASSRSSARRWPPASATAWTVQFLRKAVHRQGQARRPLLQPRRAPSRTTASSGPRPAQARTRRAT